MIRSYTYMNDPNEVRIESMDRHQHYYYYYPVGSVIQQIGSLSEWWGNQHEDGVNYDDLSHRHNDDQGY
jgi:hypothetical protein